MMVFVLFSVIPASSQNSPCVHDSENFRCVKFIRNYDGDTVTVKIPNIHPLFGKNISVRIKGIDTPETRTSDPCEKNRARTARRLVGNILKNAKRVDLLNVTRGKYFRIVADIEADGRQLKDILLEEKLAYSYSGGKKVAQDWCNFDRTPAKK